MADGATEFDFGDFLSVANTNINFSGSSFTVEFFYNITKLPTAEVVLFGNYTTLGTYSVKIYLDTSGNLNGETTDSNNSVVNAFSLLYNGLKVWNHVVVEGTASSQWFFANGQRSNINSSAFNLRSATTARIGYQASGKWNGVISNLRVVKGNTVYGSSNTTITVPTSRLTAVTNTKILTCVEHNSITDQSGLNTTITVNGSPRAILASPFTTYNGVISREDFDPLLYDPSKNQRFQSIDMRRRYT